MFVLFSSDSRLSNQANSQDISCSFSDLRFMLLRSSTFRITFPQMHPQLIFLFHLETYLPLWDPQVCTFDIASRQEFLMFFQEYITATDLFFVSKDILETSIFLFIVRRPNNDLIILKDTPYTLSSKLIFIPCVWNKLCRLLGRGLNFHTDSL